MQIVQKEKKYKPNFASVNTPDLESEAAKKLLENSIKEHKLHKSNDKNNDINILEMSKGIKNLFDILSKETQEVQDNLYEQIVNNTDDYLTEYLNLFDQQFEEALTKSIFEYKINYIACIYRYDEKYNSEKLKCQNVETKLLFHGTNSYSISRILSGHFRESSVHIFGPGYYFSDLLDYTWYYADDSGKSGSRKNFNNIPKINDFFFFYFSFYIL